MGRCLACCQENCGRLCPKCDCWCHDSPFMGGGLNLKGNVQIKFPRPKSPCKDHRTYKAIRRPTTGCEECWRFYVRMNPRIG